MLFNKLILCFFLFGLAATFTIQSDLQNVGSQTSNNFTDEMKQNLKAMINNSTQMYRRYQLTNMASFISKGMSSSYGDIWQVFVFGEGTDTCNFSTSTNTTQWAVWSDYGLYSLCYVLYRAKNCIRSTTEVDYSKLTQQQDWGASFSYSDQQRILALVDQALSYGGDDMKINTQYIASRIGAGSGGWGIVIGGPSYGIGTSVCYYRSFYAYLIDYSDLLWTYAIIRQF